MNSDQSIYQLANAGVQSLVPYQPGKPISELERELGLQNIIKLASNESPVGPSPHAIAAMQAELAEISRYPDGSGFALKASLANKLGVQIEQITLGNGSNEILELVARTFLHAHSEVIFSQHAFAVYPLVTQAIGATACVVPAHQFGHDLDAMLESVNNNTRLIFIANPNNPTGTYVNSVDLRRFLDKLPGHIICVLDEAYFEYVQRTDYPDAVCWLDSYPNLLITRTFSKAYGLAGMRIGYGLCSSEMADLLNRVRQPFNINSLALAAAEAAIQDQEHLRLSVTTNRDGMRQLSSAFDKMGLEWIPSIANFITVDIRQNALPVYQALLKQGVIVRPVANYELPEHLRISIGTETENLFLLDKLAVVLRDV